MSWRDAVVEYVRENARPVDKYDHQPRLYALTRMIGEGEVYDDDVVFAAVWLHDLGVFVGHRPEDPVALARWDNVIYACDRTPALLRRFNFPEGKISSVVDAIRTHQPNALPTSTEGVILRDADILEQLGAVAIVRAMAKIGRDTRYAKHDDVIPVLEKAVRDLPTLIRLERARQLAQPRVAALQDFLSELERETNLPT